jgi:valyl-tRNA synthetase
MSIGGSYDPAHIESDIYRFWEEGGHFHAVANPLKKPYVIDIPLPNVTGALHLGHAINDTLQDILIRRARMQGYEALWMPGTDHAGIATQAVVERKLKEEQNLTRHELGREGLVKKIWEWKEDYGSRILNQLRKMGFSCDWERTRFTLDEVCAKAVYEAFFQWFKAGLIYRGLRLVNWDAFLQTAVADDEIVHETVKGHLWHIRYPLEGGGTEARRHAGTEGRDYLIVATTRPETMLGDTAIAVHPDDERYQHLIGKRCILPLMNRPIPIIADDILVKKEFGTGCVKVTPGHDPNDYAFAQRHGVEMINILTPDGKINDRGGAYVGLDRYAARKKVVADLEGLGLVEKIEPYETEVGHSDRSKTPIEPLLSEQWFVKMGDLAETAMEAVRDGRMRFFPDRYARTFLDWLGEKRDWCISRQLWWGHRIPVWTFRFSIQDYGDWDLVFLAGGLDHLIKGNHGYKSVNESNFCLRFVRSADQSVVPDARIFLRSPRREIYGDYIAQVCYTGGDPTVAQGLEEAGFVQDPDVLDTWFSSGLWPMSTLGWPDNYGRDEIRDAGASPRSAPTARAAVADGVTDLEYFFPTSVLVTGREIITLWVARMAVFSLYFKGRVPFQHVYIHPNIQDGQGRRMSKSLGNGVDPLDIIEMYGTDALRFTMAQMATETQDVRLPVKATKLPDGRQVNTSEKFELGRNFCNKIWQAATGFVLPNLSAAGPDAWAQPLRLDDLAIEDRWILSRLAGCIADVNQRYDRYQISEMTGRLYSFFWSDFCDWYVELVKPRLYAANPPPSQGGAGGGSNPPVVPPRQGDGSQAAVARRVLAFVLDQALRLMHPVIPFITEALWQKLNVSAPFRGLRDPRRGEPALIKAAWPDADGFVVEPAIEREMAALQEVIKALRDTLVRINTSRAATKQPAIGKLPQALIRPGAEIAAGLQRQHAVLERLGRCQALTIGPDVTKPPESATKVLTGVEVYVPLRGLMDLTAERDRLRRERDELGGHIERLAGKLGNPGFVAKAPAAVVEQERQRLDDMRQRQAAIALNLADLE